MSSNLGLNITLPSGTLSQLKRDRSNNLSPPHRQYDLFDLRNDNHDSDEEENNDDDQSVEILQNIVTNTTAQSQNHFLKKEDMEIMPFVPSDSGDDDSDADSNVKDDCFDSQEEEHNDDGYYSDGMNDETDELDNLSLSPPETMPLLVVSLDKLCGYTPSDKNEAKQLENELCEALLGAKTNEENNDNDSTTNLEKESAPTSSESKDEKSNLLTNNEYGDGFSLDFTTRAIELLEAGVAQHCDTNQQQSDFANNNEKGSLLNHAFVPYPEFMKLSQSDENGESKIMATSKIWKRIIHPHGIPVVDKLLDLLSKCSRDLMWKHDMSMEIRRIAKEERRWQEEKIRKKELKIWRTQTRPDELEKLYDVREAFILKLETVRKKYDGYVKEREERVQKELLRRKENGVGTGGIAGLDWDGKVTFAFDDDVEEIIQKILREKQENEDDVSPSGQTTDHSPSDESEDQYDDGYECDEGDHEISDVEIDDEKSPQHHSDGILPERNRNNTSRKSRKAKSASKRMQKKLQAEKENAKAAELRAKIELAHKEEQQVRDMCISTDEKLAMVMVNNLEERLERVDNLLDSLQMDAWNDEEEGLLEHNESDSDCDDENTPNAGEMNLLDNILAMVLGAMPPKQSNTQDHFTSLKNEHKSIVQEWQQTFGRVPKLKREKQQHESDIVQKLAKTSIWDDDEQGLPSDITAKDQKFTTKLNIPDDWEDEADSCDENGLLEIRKSEELVDDDNDTKIGNSMKLNSPSVTIGLRPGGKIRF